jgi:hypothetical protein
MVSDMSTTRTIDTRPRLTELPTDMLERFRFRAAELDRTNTYFDEDLAELREIGYLAAAVPAHLGGWGLSLAELAASQRRLARYAPATALATTMHSYWIGIANELERGTVDLQAVLDPVGGAAFKSELDRLEHQLYLQDKKSGNLCTVTQRRADALVEMAKRSRTTKPGGLRPRPLITIHTGQTSFARICELAAGTVITSGRVVPHLAEADIERIVFDGPDRVLSVSKRRRFSGALRRGDPSPRPPLPTPLRL